MSSTPRQRSAGPPLWRKFLSPGWVLACVFIIIFSYFAFTLLAPWQLNKDDAIVERNHQIEAAYEADPVPVEDLLSADDAFTEDEQWTRVVLEGEFLTDDEVLLRLRPVENTNTYQVLTPFRLDSGDVVLVNRGYVPTGGSNTVPEIPAAPQGRVSTVGMAQLPEGRGDRAPLDEQGYTHVYTMNPELIGELTGEQLVDGYVQLNSDQPGVINAIPIPMLERGSHLSYGFQWLTFGIMAPLGFLYFIVSEVRERRRVREEDREMDEEMTNAPEEEDLSTHPDAKVVQRSRTVRDRYGDANTDHYSKYAKRLRER